MPHEYRCSTEGCQTRIDADAVERRIGDVRVVPGQVFCAAHGPLAEFVMFRVEKPTPRDSRLPR